MKITVHTNEIDLVIPIPNFLIDSMMTRSILQKGIKECGHEVYIDERTVNVFLKELAGIAKQYKGLEILCAQTASGEIVKVEL